VVWEEIRTVVVKLKFIYRYETKINKPKIGQYFSMIGAWICFNDYSSSDLIQHPKKILLDLFVPQLRKAPNVPFRKDLIRLT
jgi:hypothetical protein